MSDDQHDQESDVRSIQACADDLVAHRTDKFLELCDLARRESSRGLVLMIAESLSETLADLLVGVAVDRKLMKKELEWRGIFGSFAARARAAYLLGIIRGSDFHFIEAVRRLRNDAAHTRSEFSLAAPSPSTAKCMAKIPLRDLNPPPHSNVSPEENERIKLLLYVAVNSGHLHEQAGGTRPNERRERLAR